MPGRVIAAVLTVGLVFAVSCTSVFDDSGAPAPRGVAEVTHVPAEVGETLANDGVEVVVRSIEAYDRSERSFPRLRLVVRSRNTGNDDASNPQIGLHCDESDAAGEWDIGSTWEAAGFLPEGSFSEGEFFAAFPSKTDRRFYPLASCTNARLEIIVGDSSAPAVFDIAVPADVIDDALTRPNGPRFPLPTIVS